DGEEDRDVVGRGAQTRDHTEDRSTFGRAVVDERKRQRQLVGRLADGDHLVARLTEDTPTALRERLAAEAGKRLGRPKPGRRSTDEQDARQGTMRHGSE